VYPGHQNLKYATENQFKTRIYCLAIPALNRIVNQIK